jgi:hypothetical protein
MLIPSCSVDGRAQIPGRGEPNGEQRSVADE